MASLAQKASIQTSAEPTTITIGDLITYTVEIVREPDITIHWPGAAAELGQFQIVDFEPVDRTPLDDGRQCEAMTYYISTYDVGDWIIPPTAIAYFDSSDDTTVFLRTEPIPITVKSLLSEADWERIRAITEMDTTYAGMEKQIAAGRVLQMAKDDLLRDITSPKRIKRPARFWIGLAVVAIIIAGLIVGFLYWRKRRNIPGAILSFSAPAVPPREWALGEIAALVAGDWLSRREFKLFYSRLSDIVREYIERQMGVRALELSTGETMENLSASAYPIVEDDEKLLLDILERCDLVKFAKFVPPEDWHYNLIDRAKDFVEHTTPPEPEPSPETAPNVEELPAGKEAE